jgi:glycosyltransferase involved in cell wall biosynthesis
MAIQQRNYSNLNRRLKRGPAGLPAGPASSERSRLGVRTLTVSVVIPTKNEARNIGWVLERIDPLVDEVIIVDGLSADGTVDVARHVRPDVIVVHHPVRGKGEAVRAGLTRATGDLVVMLDADGSMDPGEVRRFVEELARGHDFVKGSRFLPGGGTSDMTWLRSLGNSVLVRLTNLLLRTSYSELCYGYMAFRRSRLQELRLAASGFEIETELVVKAQRAGLAITEVPSFESARRYGTSNLNTFRDGWRVLCTLLRERFAAQTPVRVVEQPREGWRRRRALSGN